MEPFVYVWSAVWNLGLARAGQRTIVKLCTLPEMGGLPKFSPLVEHYREGEEALLMILGNQSFTQGAGSRPEVTHL